MKVLNGTGTDHEIRLEFTRDEFDELCTLLRRGGGLAVDSDIGGSILRFRAGITPDRDEQDSPTA